MVEDAADNLAGREQPGYRRVVSAENAGALVHLQAAISIGYSPCNRKRGEWRVVEPDRPVALGRVEPARRQSIERPREVLAVVGGGVVLPDGRCQRVGVYPQPVFEATDQAASALFEVSAAVLAYAP